MQPQPHEHIEVLGGRSPLAKETFPPYQQWDLGLAQVDALLNCSAIPRGIAAYIQETELCRKYPVLDWGCGSGRAAGELRSKLPTDVALQAYSGEADDAWQQIRGVQFVQGSSQRLLQHCVSAGSRFSLIYSSTGLIHLLTSQMRGLDQSSELRDWADRLAPGGLLLMNDPNAFLIVDPKLQAKVFPNELSLSIQQFGMVFAVRRQAR